MSQLDERQVVDFLEQNHDFLQKHPELLTRLSVFNEPQGTTSLVRRQQHLLHSKNRELSDKLNVLLANANHNEVIFHAFNQGYRELLQASSRSQLSTRLNKVFCQAFNLLDCQLINFDADKHQTLLTQRLTQQSSFLGRLSQDEQFLLFAQSAPSAAVYLIGSAESPQAILAFASKDEAHYHPEQSSVFVLEFIKALEIKLAQL